VLNVVLNALRAMPGGGCIEISGHKFCAGENKQMTEEQASRNPGRIVISIADTGPGVAPAHLPRIFEAGFSTRDGSPGLGLAVCRKVAQQHGGTLTASNRVGGGAEFVLSFPLGQKTPSGEMLRSA
jgi:signal transduction histidine kinase